MKTAYIDIPHEKWGVVVVYDYDVEYDYEELAEQMMSFGLPYHKAENALDILCDPNTGMALSNETLRMSIIFVSDATSPSEWYNTAIHEFIHVADAILDYYGEIWGGEPSAYLVGYMTKELVELVGKPCVL